MDWSGCRISSIRGGRSRVRRSGLTPAPPPRPRTLWKRAGLAKVVEWDNFDLSVMAEIGQGEFATAWATELDGDKVVVKVLKPHKRQVVEAVKGMKREIMLMSMMSHPNVLKATAIGYFKDDGVPFLALGRLCSVLNRELPADPDSQPFWVTWRQRKAWSLSRALGYGVQLASALRYCHDEALWTVTGFSTRHQAEQHRIYAAGRDERAGETLGRLVIRLRADQHLDPQGRIRGAPNLKDEQQPDRERRSATWHPRAPAAHTTISPRSLSATAWEMAAKKALQRHSDIFVAP